MGLIALKTMKVEGPRGVSPGDPVPELESARNLQAMIETGMVCREGDEPPWLKSTPKPAHAALESPAWPDTKAESDPVAGEELSTLSKPATPPKKKKGRKPFRRGYSADK